jgi:hypothetical protein
MQRYPREYDSNTLCTRGYSGPRAGNDALTNVKHAFHNYITLLTADSCVQNWTILGKASVQRNFNTIQTTQDDEIMKCKLKLTCFS